MSGLMRGGAAHVSGPTGGRLLAYSFPPQNNSVLVRTDNPGPWEVRHVAIAAGNSVRVDVEVAIRVPSERIPVIAGIHIPIVVRAVGDAVGRVALRVISG